MFKAARLIASTIGIYAGILGAIHGYFEIQQGAISPDSLIIQAIGAPCQPDAISHACWPAMTLIPNLQISGILAIVFSIAALLWAAFFITHKRGSLILALLAIGMLLVGAGFFPPFYAMIAAAAGTQINGTLSWWRKRLSARTAQILAGLWPWLIIVYLLWAGIQLIFGEALSGFLLSTGGMLIPIEMGALLLSVISAFAHDIINTSHPLRKEA